jgi:hypothetical protein
VFDQIRNKIAEPLLRLARPELKNIHVPIDVYRLVLPWAPGAVQPAGPFSVRWRPGARFAFLAALIGVAGLLLTWWATARRLYAPSASPSAGEATAA